MPIIDNVSLNYKRRKIGGKWKPAILYVLYNKPERFNRIKMLIPGISAKMLTSTLKEMEKNQLIKKCDDKYVLTDPATRITALFHQIQEIVDTLPILLLICIEVLPAVQLWKGE